MYPKYSNIFWHQGVKVFEEDIINSEKGRIRVAHLENDVTKTLINYFGANTTKKTITWESISRKLKSIAINDPLDKFLVDQFCDFLELIGIAEFNGFRKSDFTQ